MKNNLLLFFAFLLINANVKVFAADDLKSQNWCGSESPSMQWENQLQRIISNQQLQNAGSRQQQISYVIPVVVHVVYWTTAQNISAAQVQSQITVLNNDFAGVGLNSGTIPAAFASLKANSNITFCLAKLDPNNNVMAEPGIDRVSAQTRNWLNPGTQGWERTYIDGTIKPATIWNPNYYLNIWVVRGIRGSSGGTILGYATFPGLTGLDGMPSGAGNELNDGFVCRGDYFGTTGTANGTFGRTSTHEIGHWLGLRHIWGDDSCGTDYVNDTPTALEENYNCPAYPHRSCGNTTSGDMFMNFMDYTDDNCMALFTNDQSARFQTTMQFGEFRKNIPFSPACDTVKQKPSPNFTYLKANAGLCATSQTFSFTDKSIFAPTSWSWTFEGGTPATSTVKNPSNIVFNTPGLHNVTLVATNSRGSSTIIKQINVPIVTAGTLPLAEGFEGDAFPPIGWDFVNRNGNPAINWDFITGYSAYGVGNKAMRFDNTTLDGGLKKDDIMTSKLNFTGVTSSKLKFDIAYAPFYGDAGNGVDESIFDTLEVLITDNCQSTTQRLYIKGGTALATFLPGQGDEFYPLPTQWRTDSVAIPAAYLNKPNVQIIFRNYGNYGHTIYVDNINISVPNASPTATASFTASDTTVCIGSSLTFTNTSTASVGSPDSVRWTIAGGTPSTSTSTTTVVSTFNTAGTYVVSLVAYKSGIASAAVTKSIRVKPNAVITLSSAPGSNTQTKCVSTAITTITFAVTNATGATLTGTLPAGVTGSFAGGVFTISGTPTATGTFNYTVTATGGCTSPTQTGTITVTPNATIALSSATGTNVQSKCINTAITTITFAVTNATGATLTGTLPAGVTGSFAGGVFTISGTPTATGTFNYTVTATGGCTSPTQTGTITVTAASAVALTSATGTNAQSKCVSTAITAITYSISGATGADVTGLPTGVTGTYSGGVVTISGTPTAVGPFNYTVTATGGCTAASATGTITVNALPTVAALTGTASVCVGSTTTFSSTTTGGTWSSSSAAATVNGSGVITGVSNGTATISYTVTSSGCSTTVTRDVTVNALPNVTVTSPNICAGSTATITANGANSYTWTGGLSGNPATTPVLNATTQYTVTGTVTATQCTNTAVSTVTVSTSAPTVAITSVPAGGSVCIGEAVTLTASGANNYTWTSSLGTVNGGTYTFTPTGDITVSLSGTLTGCTAAGTSSINVTVKSKPTVGVSSPVICSGQTATIIASGADSYTWTGGLAAVENPTTPVLNGNASYTVTGTQNGCTNTAVSTVTVNPTPATPSITQSGDTLNSSTIVVGASYEWYLGATLEATTLDPFFKFTTAGSYTVKVKTSDCTSAASAPFSASATGVRNTNSIKLFEVYPNPTEGRLVLNLNLYKLSSVNISIYTPEGREVYVKAYGMTKALSDELSINSFAKGVYIIKLRVDEETYYQKVVKN